MGFPLWTLWGMGISVGLALLFSLLAYIAISPGLARSLGLGRLRLDARLRTFVSFTFASLLVGSGFFAAGVPLETVPAGEPAAVVVLSPTADIPLVATASSQTGAMGSDLPTATATLPSETSGDGVVSGAMGETAVEPTAPITETAVLTPTETVLDQTPTIEPTETVPAVTETPEPTATNLPTATPSSTPTETPTPTVSPTPILEETAVIDTGGGTLWLHRSPGGQQLMVLQANDLVIPTTGRANRDGLIWREVRTVEGVLGWVQERFIRYGGDE